MMHLRAGLHARPILALAGPERALRIEVPNPRLGCTPGGDGGAIPLPHPTGLGVAICRDLRAMVIATTGTRAGEHTERHD